MRKQEKIKGISLITLAITIVVMLILAGAIIAAFNTPNDMTQKANDARMATNLANAKGDLTAKYTEWQYDHLEEDLTQSNLQDMLEESGFTLQKYDLQDEYIVIVDPDGLPIIVNGATPENCQVKILSTEGKVGTLEVTLQLYADYATSMYISNESTSPNENTVWESYTTNKRHTLSSGGGYDKTVYVWFRSGSGMISEVVHDTVTYALIPYDCIISINNGVPTTNSQNVTLELHAENATSMYISNSNVAPTNASTWIPYTTSKSHTLTNGEGNKIVYVWFKSETGEISTANDSIIYESITPTQCTIAINNGASTTNSQNVTLELHAENATSMYISNSNVAPTNVSTWIPYTTSKSHTLTEEYGMKTVYVWYKSVDGKVASANDSIEYIRDTSIPYTQNIIIAHTPTTPRNTQNTGMLNGVETGPITATITYEGVQYAQYRVGTSGEWTNVSNVIENIPITSNCTVQARYYNNPMEAKLTEHIIENVDNEVPNAPVLDWGTYTPGSTAYADVTAMFSATDIGCAGVLRYEATTDGGISWDTVTSPMTITTSATYQFRAIDRAGNASIPTQEYTVVIDKAWMIGDGIIITADTTNPTNIPVPYTITYGNYNITKEYKIVLASGGTASWNTLTQGVSISDNATTNCTIYARYVYNGIASTEVSLEINNIDTVLPILYLNTNGYVSGSDTPSAVYISLSASDSASAGAQSGISGVVGYEESTNGGSTWSTVTSTSFNRSSSATYIYRAIDKAGNYSQTQSVKIVMGISGSVSFTPSSTEPTNQNVKLTMTYSGTAISGGHIEYKTGILGSWTSGTSNSKTSVISFSENKSLIYGRYCVGDICTDSKTTSIKNIDKVAPTITITGTLENGTTYVSGQTASKALTITMDASDEASDYASSSIAGVVKYERKVDSGSWKTISASTTTNACASHTFYFRVTDKAGNVSNTVSIKYVHYNALFSSPCSETY